MRHASLTVAVAVFLASAMGCIDGLSTDTMMSATVMSDALRARVYPPPGPLVDSTSSWRRSFPTTAQDKKEKSVGVGAHGGQCDRASALAQTQIDHRGNRKRPLVVRRIKCSFSCTWLMNWLKYSKKPSVTGPGNRYSPPCGVPICCQWRWE